MEKLESGASENEALKAGLEAAKVDFGMGLVANMGIVSKIIGQFFPNVDVSKLDEGTVYDLLKSIIDNI